MCIARAKTARFSSGGEIVPHCEKCAMKTQLSIPVLRNFISYCEI
jgi:hypothetical protein